MWAVDEIRPGLEGVVAFETTIAEPDKEGSALRYRGVDIEELVGRYPFEQVWGLLVDESLEPGMPQAEHIVWVSTRSRPIPPPAGRAARFALHALHRFGSFLKFLSAKNCCSPAVQMNSVAQSTHLRIRSWNSIGRYLVGVGSLLRFAPELLAVPFPRERLLGPAFITRFQVEGMLLDILDDVFLLDLPLEPAESALNRLALLDFYFSH